MPETEWQTNQLLGKLLERTDNLIEDVGDIKKELVTNAIRTEARLVALELKNAEAQGGTKMMMLFGGAAATIGGIVSHFAGKIWGG